MAIGKQRLTFISYSRADKDFALELAKELKASGFNVWLDQLDIAAGARWDDEVEKALVNCEIFMIILTPDSTSSNNVKDEIGYAIDSNKRILPVLLENANVPFRLRRFQYVDFTNKSTNEGIDLAKQLLQRLVDEPTGPNPVIPSPVKGPAPQPPHHSNRLEREKEPGPDPVAAAERLARQREVIRKAREQEQLQRSAQPAPQYQTYSPPAPPQQAVKRAASPVMYFVIGIPILLVLCLGGGWIAWPFIFPPVTPATPPTLSPIPPPTDTPFVTQEITPSVTLTPTPEITPTVTAFAPQEPDQFLNFYFETLIYTRDYDLAWSLLSDTFKSVNNPAGFTDWKNTWAKVYEWRRPDWTVSYASPSTAFVSTPELWFRGTSWYSLTNREYCVIRDESRNTWILESRSACGR